VPIAAGEDEASGKRDGCVVAHQCNKQQHAKSIPEGDIQIMLLNEKHFDPKHISLLE
jgi:hypothetical protein